MRSLLAGLLIGATLASFAQTAPPFTRETMGKPLAQTRAAAVPGAEPGFIDIGERYGISFMTDATLLDLGMTYADAQTAFPYFCEWAALEGWSQNEVLGQYKITCAINDALWVNDTYIGWGPYMLRVNRISQSRTRIKLPHGTFRESGTAVVALGWVTGQGSNVYGQAMATPSAPAGTTPGTMFTIDHVKWNKTRYPDRILMRTSSYGVDFGIAGGIAYSEGTIVEGIRFNGDWHGAPDPTWHSAGFASGDLGECSTIRNCFASSFNGDGFVSMNGTPANYYACSSFDNTRLGFATLCTNGLNTTNYYGCSSDNCKEGKYGNRPWTTGSVCGGTYGIFGDKLEVRTGGIFASFQGQVNVSITCSQYDVSTAAGPPMAEAIRMTPQGKNWQISMHSVQHGFNVQSLILNTETGQRLSSPGPYVQWSVDVNNSTMNGGIHNATREGFAWSGGGTTPGSCSWVPGTETCTACSGGNQTCTTQYVTSQAGCDPAAGPNGVPKPAPLTQVRPCGTTGGLTAEATAQLPDHPASMGVDGSMDSFYQNGRGKRVGDTYTVSFTSRSVKGVTFTSPANWGFNWPLTFTVDTYNNNTWTKGSTVYSGQQAGSVATFPAKTCSKIRIVIASIPYPEGPWWSINNLTLQ